MKSLFSIVFKTHTPHYIHTTFRQLPFSSSGEHCIVSKFKKKLQLLILDF